MGPPSNFSATTVTGTSITLVWQVPFDASQVSYFLLTRDGVSISNLPTASLSYVDSPLLTNRRYTYSIRCVDLWGSGSTVSIFFTSTNRR